MHMIARDDKEGRKKQARSNKQQGNSTAKAVTFPKKNDCLVAIKVQTLGTLYACASLIDGLGHTMRSATYLSQVGCVIVSGYISPEQRWTWIHIPLVTSTVC